MKSQVHQLARPEAIKAYDSLSDDISSVLSNGPGWTVQTYKALLLFIILTLIFSLVARIHTYTDGIGIIHLGENHRVIAKQAGTVEVIHVEPGDNAIAGQLLMEFYSQPQLDEYQEAKAEYESAVRRWLFNSDTAKDVVSARNQYHLAQAKLSEQRIRAQHNGPVSDIRVGKGQSVVRGQILMAQGGDSLAQTVSIYLPGQMRPKLSTGQQVILEFRDHQFAKLELILTKIDNELIGIDEAKSRIGFGLGEILSLPGPIIRAEAALNEAYFEADGDRFPLHDGMVAKAQVVLESEPLALAFLPDFE